MTQLPFRSDAHGTADDGPDNLVTAQGAGTVAGDSVFANGLETGEASEDDVLATVIPAGAFTASSNIPTAGS